MIKKIWNKFKKIYNKHKVLSIIFMGIILVVLLLYFTAMTIGIILAAVFIKRGYTQSIGNVIANDINDLVKTKWKFNSGNNTTDDASKMILVKLFYTYVDMRLSEGKEDIEEFLNIIYTDSKSKEYKDKLNKYLKSTKSTFNKDIKDWIAFKVLKKIGLLNFTKFMELKDEYKQSEILKALYKNRIKFSSPLDNKIFELYRKTGRFEISDKSKLLLIKKIIKDNKSLFDLILGAIENKN